MNEKQLFKEFTKISAVKPDQAWKAKNRELLLNQISSAQEITKLSYFNFALKSFSLIPQPVIVAVFILAMTLSGGFLGLYAAQNSVPGDSLYIAKIAGEKTQFALTFNDKNKARLGLEFAGNRAKEINQVLTDVNIIDDKSERVEKLVLDFRREIDETKSRLEKINQNSKPVDVNNEKPLVVNSEKDSEEDQVEEIKLTQDDSEAGEEESHMFSANLGRDDNGLEVYDPNTSDGGEDAVLNTDEEIAIANEDSQNASTSKEDVVAVTDVSETNPEEMLKQAGDLLDGDDIEATLNLMEEAGQVIDQQVEEQTVDESEAVAEDGNATSTDDLNAETVDNEDGSASTSAVINE